MQLHPLLNPNSTHYEDEGRVSIQEMEKEITVIEMVGYCKGNIFRYEFRKHNKGALEADEVKKKTHEAYIAVLKDMASLSLGNHFVADALKMTKREFAYRQNELNNANSLFE